MAVVDRQVLSLARPIERLTDICFHSFAVKFKADGKPVVVLVQNLKLISFPTTYFSCFLSAQRDESLLVRFVSRVDLPILRWNAHVYFLFVRVALHLLNLVHKSHPLHPHQLGSVVEILHLVDCFGLGHRVLGITFTHQIVRPIHTNIILSQLYAP